MISGNAKMMDEFEVAGVMVNQIAQDILKKYQKGITAYIQIKGQNNHFKIDE